MKSTVRLVFAVCALTTSGTAMAAASNADLQAKLEAMCEGTRMARMWLSKQQSDPD